MPKKKTEIPSDCLPMCRTCAFAKLEDGIGMCHRNPPVFISDDEGSGFTFPLVTEDDWCGQYLRKVN